MKQQKNTQRRSARERLQQLRQMRLDSVGLLVRERLQSGGLSAREWIQRNSGPARAWLERQLRKVEVWIYRGEAWLWRKSLPLQAWVEERSRRAGGYLWEKSRPTLERLWRKYQPVLQRWWSENQPKLKRLWRKNLPRLEKLGRIDAREWARVKSKPTLERLWRKSAPARKWIIRESRPWIKRIDEFLTRRRRLLRAALSRISVRLYLGMGGVVLLTMLISVVAWFSFARVDDAQVDVNQYIPEMVTAFSLARESSGLIDAASRLSAAATREDFEQVREVVRDDRARFEAGLNELLRQEERNYLINQVRVAAQALLANLSAIERSVADRFTLGERVGELQRELAALQRLMERQLVGLVDDQFFYALTGYRELGAPRRAARGEPFIRDEFYSFNYLTQLQLASGLGVQVLASAFNASDADQLEPLQERFESVAATVNWSLDNMGDYLAPLPELWSGLNRLLEMGSGKASNFGLQRRVLRLEEEQRNLLQVNRDLAARLGTVTRQNIETARAQSLSATHGAAETISSGRVRLLWFTALVLVISWFYIGTLVERIRVLLNRMHRMAAGELDAQVEIGGTDEVAEMAEALEGFRRSSLDAQRLGLVERMAEELRGKNEELEKVLGELKQAQEQIVMREKLAALGELTAGVAHEIKNPLNFVKNFSEGSIELLTELKEVVADKSRPDKERLNSLVGIGEDLEENLSSILRNGERANRIVQDMLSMGRGSGELQMVDLNTLVTEHANLAYHAARAADPEFQLTIKEDLDPNAGKIEAIPHDLGRVFLNMVNNACYATEEKRKQVEKETGARLKAGEGYEPTVTLTTRREPGQVTVTIHDNGTGIPKEMVDEVFNPFFTTKPPDKGTGLGLALSNDIVVQHGGAISVNTKAGQFTKMSVFLPAKSGAAE